jgi:hypothetical protein
MKDWKNDWRWFYSMADGQTYQAGWFSDEDGAWRSGTNFNIAKFGARMYQRGYEEARQEILDSGAQKELK